MVELQFVFIRDCESRLWYYWDSLDTGSVLRVKTTVLKPSVTKEWVDSGAVTESVK